MQVFSVRWVTGLFLILGLGFAAASGSVANVDEQYQACCNCLSRSRNDFSEPCIGDTTSQCVDKVSQGQPVSSSTRCLRDLCAEDCSEVSAPAAEAAELETCCDCLATRQDPSGVDCMSESAEQCVQALDNGHSVASTQGCFDESCRGRCDFLSLHSADAGVASQDAG